MALRREYKTRQKDKILACLREHAGGHITADMIRAHLLLDGEQVGLTTVYRNLERLVQDGTIIKYTGMNSASASFQYVGNPEEHQEHYHLVCLCCGHLEHLDCNIIDEFSAHIQNDHGFTLNNMKTVFYGYCASCASQLAQTGGSIAPPAKSVK